MDPELMALFRSDAHEQIDALEAQLLAIEVGDTPDLGDLFRVAHSLKGNAGLVGFSDLADFAHRLEDALAEVRAGRRHLDPPLVELLLSSVDVLRAFVETAHGRLEGAIITTRTALRERLDHWIGLASAPPAEETAPSSLIRAPHTTPTAPPPSPQATLAAEPAELGDPSDPPVISTPGPVTSAPDPTPAPAPDPKPAPAPAPAESRRPADANTNTVRVRVALLDTLMTLTEEMVLTRNQLRLGAEAEDALLVAQASRRLEQLSADLQETVMATRMQPLRGVFQRFNRIVRDLGRELGKDVALAVAGDDVELDRALLDVLLDPLTHMVRNAMDHGIEPPAERVASGKPPRGRLELRAHRQGDAVIVEVVDDGRGIDPERIRARALAMGIPSAETLTERELLDLLFTPGFSTATTPTQVSGRGVGLDVALTRLTQVGGAVSLSGAPGEGCVGRLRVPVTLAILPSLLVSVEGEIYAIPQSDVEELVRIPPGDGDRRLRELAGLDVLAHRDRFIPIVTLREVLGIPQPTYADADGDRHPDRRARVVDRREISDGPTHGDRRRGRDRRRAATSARSLVVLRSRDVTYALMVDALVDTLEIVAKPLGPPLHRVPLYTGGTVLGNGQVALILDAGGILRAAALRPAALSALLDTATDESQAVLEHESMELLLIRSASGTLYGITPDRVRHVIRANTRDLEVALGRRALRVSGKVLPVFDLSPIEPVPSDVGARMGVVFEVAGREMLLLCERVEDLYTTDAAPDEFAFARPGVYGSVPHPEGPALLLDLDELVGLTIPEWAALAPAPAVSEKPRVLLAEDSRFYREQVAKMLKSFGYEVAVAENGQEALAWLESHPTPALLVSDLEMPVLDGFGLIRAVRASDRLGALPVLALTSLTGPQIEARCAAEGFNAYSTKLSRPDVQRKCTRLLEEARR